MATIYKYSILINFAHQNANLHNLPNARVPYNAMHCDTFCFNASSIRIYAERYNRINDDEASLYHVNHSINRQIQKAIEYYYLTCPVYTHVQAIYIRIKTNSKKSRYSPYASAKKFVEPLSKKLKGNNSWQFSPNDMQPMLYEDAKAITYRTALSYCLKSAIESTDFARFSNLWRAFNALYRYGSTSSMDSRGLSFAESIIKNNYLLLSNSAANISTYRAILPTLRWIRFINNKIARDKERTPMGTGTRAFMLHYNDLQINQILALLLRPERGIYAKISTISGTSVNAINQRVQGKISRRLRDDAEILVVLIKDYAYYLRNTLFHGAVDEPSFKLGETQEQKELGMAKTWLECLIKDLLNNHFI